MSPADSDSQWRERLAGVRLVVFDVDGVLTDGRIYLTADGEEMKVFHARDGLGIRMLKRAGIEVAVISGRQSRVVSQRMSALDVAHVFQGRDDKLPLFRELLEQLGVDADEAVYVGDDVIDLPVMAAAGTGIAVADAHPAVRRAADWVTTTAGGHGAGREVCDAILEAGGHLEPGQRPGN